MRCRKKIGQKKNYRSEFPQTSFIYVINLFKEVYRKIMSEIFFVGKTRYEALTETGSQVCIVLYCIVLYCNISLRILLAVGSRVRKQEKPINFSQF